MLYIVHMEKNIYWYTLAIKIRCKLPEINWFSLYYICIDLIKFKIFNLQSWERPSNMYAYPHLKFFTLMTNSCFQIPFAKIYKFPRTCAPLLLSTTLQIPALNECPWASMAMAKSSLASNLQKTPFLCLL